MVCEIIVSVVLFRQWRSAVVKESVINVTNHSRIYHSVNNTCDCDIAKDNDKTAAVHTWGLDYGGKHPYSGRPKPLITPCKVIPG